MPMLTMVPKKYLAARPNGHGTFAVDALMALAVLVIIVFAMVASVALLGSADWSAALRSSSGPLNTRASATFPAASNVNSTTTAP